MDKIQIAEKLKCIMQSKGLSPMDLSNLTGISRSTIEGYIKAKSLLKLDSLIVICDKLQISADAFLELEALPASQTEDEKELLALYRQLDRRGKAKTTVVCYEELDRIRSEKKGGSISKQSAG